MSNKYSPISYQEKEGGGEWHMFIPLLDQVYNIDLNTKLKIVIIRRHQKECNMNTACDAERIHEDHPGYHNIVAAFVKWRNE